jgi:hypothetical protein
MESINKHVTKQDTYFVDDAVYVSVSLVLFSVFISCLGRYPQTWSISSLLSNLPLFTDYLLLFFILRHIHFMCESSNNNPSPPFGAVTECVLCVSIPSQAHLSQKSEPTFNAALPRLLIQPFHISLFTNIQWCIHKNLKEWKVTVFMNLSCHFSVLLTDTQHVITMTGLSDSPKGFLSVS